MLRLTLIVALVTAVAMATTWEELSVDVSLAASAYRHLRSCDVNDKEEPCDGLEGLASCAYVLNDRVTRARAACSGLTTKLCIQEAKDLIWVYDRCYYP
jgi:hypothetical protein